ncbi:MAG: hypothetical protein Fur0021_12450 [Candidatus Promineifilaceae bacterium]
MRKGIIILLILATAILSLWSWGRALSLMSPAAAATLAGTGRYVALIGEPTNIISVTQAFVTAQALKPLRTYSETNSYIREAPPPIGGQVYLPGTIVQLYEVTTDTLHAGQVLSQVVAAAAQFSVTATTENLGWLSYLPGRVIVSGECKKIDVVVSTMPGLTEMARLPLRAAALPPGCQEIRLYALAIGSVSDLVAAINSMGIIAAGPDYLIVGADEEYVAGSPAGPQEPDAPPLHAATSTCLGNDVRVVLFDTLPYAVAPADGSVPVTITGATVTASAPYTLPESLPVGAYAVPAHGTFAASTALAVAPEADVHLVRVLNDTGIGNLFTLFQAMSAMVTQTLAVSNTLAGAVFNYSLVIEASPSSVTTTVGIAQVLETVENAGIVQVAAAGNDSAFTTAPQPMPFPAAGENVLGVTAVTWQGELACYANQGDVALLGGGIPRDAGDCHVPDLVAACRHGGHPEYCVTGWDPDTAFTATQYDWGMGTSFAAPGAAALAAQLMACENAPWTPPAAVYAGLLELATPGNDGALGAGVLPNLYLLPAGQIYLPVLPKSEASFAAGAAREASREP